MAVRILSSDLLICDVILPLAGNADLRPLIAGYNRAHPEHPIALGSKSPLTPEEFHAWEKAIAGRGEYVAGGSAANTLSALKKLMGDSLQVDFIAAYGEDAAGRVIAESLARDGLHLLPQTAPFPDVQTATSFVLVNEQGERSILGYGGNSREKILAAFAAKNLPDDYDILFLPGSLWQKYGGDFAQALVGCGRKLWLSLPTHSQSGRQYNEAVRALIPQAQVVLANADELKRMFAASDTQTALKMLQSQLSGGQIAFITDGVRGATIVSSSAMHSVAAEAVPAAQIKNTLGAGDAAFAGFLYGLLTDAADIDRAGRIAMQLAAAALQVPSARLTEIPPI
ncbi:MAG: carbohydrate kinase family protein [Alphaproteobacteria bacterium]|nr:carbohydrate kinase family protein [Alphaproteobacteria bacterium]